MRKIFAVMLVSACPTALFAATPDWTISESSGPVQVTHGGVSRVATRGGQLMPGDVVSTGRGGRAVIVRGEEYMMVAASSRLRLPDQPEASGFSKVVEEAGNIVFMIKKKMTPHFSVETPFLAAVVKGTTFSVTVEAQQASVKVIEGAVDVSTLDGGAHNLVTPGATALVSAVNQRQLRVQSMSGDTVIDSTAAPNEPSTAPQPAKVAQTDAPAAGAGQDDPILIDEKPVSLASSTDGLISGGADDRVQLASLKLPYSTSLDTPTVAADVSLTDSVVGSFSRIAEESSSSVARAVELASAVLVLKAAADVAEQHAVAAAAATVSADAAAREAAIQAQQLAEAAAKAAADQASSEAARAAAAQAAQAAATNAARLAEEAAQAASANAAQEAARVAAQAAAQQAAAAADQAARQAEQLEAAAAQATDAASKAAADKAAADARKAADEAAAVAQKQAADAAVAAANAAQAAADQAASDAAKAAALAVADQAAKDAAKAADAAAALAQKQAADAAAAATQAAQAAAAQAASDAAKAAADAAAAQAATDAAAAAANAQLAAAQTTTTATDKAALEAQKKAAEAAAKAAKEAEAAAKKAQEEAAKQAKADAEAAAKAAEAAAKASK